MTPSTHAPAVPPELEAAGPVREATPADHVAGIAPRWVARPTSTPQVGALLRVAHAHGLRIVARGAATKQDWGLPPRTVDLVVDTTGLDQIVEYAPHDLVLRVGAGVRLATIEALLLGHAQRLGIDPPRRGTIGGTVATGVTGPMRLIHLGVRDLVIGMTFVRADGVIAKAGGKVVKNVAGYDIGKLFTGAYGTLGIITEVGF
ncbi:MAG: FAD-binding oxidoreductase, partial [Micrococcales bacterium]|nr:FAD-binding oxidoreductase [Micrococcales bacterium]